MFYNRKGGMKTQKQQGFTIIEVVLVLAIAGLIFLMVFIALPALQRSQRDTQRRNDVGRVLTAVQSYQTNNKGAVPTTAAQITGYLTSAGDTFEDPSGGNYALTASVDDASAAPTVEGAMIYNSGAICGLGGALVDANARKVAVRVFLEGGGSYCSNN